MVLSMFAGQCIEIHNNMVMFYLKNYIICYNINIEIVEIFDY